MAQSGPINPLPTYAPGLRGFIQRRAKRYRFWLRNRGRQWSAFFGNPIAGIGLGLIVFFALLGLSQPILLSTVWDAATYDPEIGFDPNLSHPALPTKGHLLGTDYQGRDVLSQLAFGTRTSFGVGIVAALVGTIVATIVGVSAAYFEGLVDTILMVVTDVFIMLPPAAVLLIVGLIFEMTWVQVGLIYGIFAGLGAFALMVKVQALSIKSKKYTLAAKVAGGGHWRIISVHILPNLASLIAVNMMFIVTGSVMIEALLSYFERSQRFSWGSMIWFTIDNFRGGIEGLQWHVIIPPAFAIMLFCGAFYMIARTLDEVVNPKLREQ